MDLNPERINSHTGPWLDRPTFTLSQSMCRPSYVDTRVRL